MPELEGLSFQIKTDAEAAKSNLESLASAFEKLKRHTSNLRGLGTAATNISKLKESAQGSDFTPLEKLANALNSLRGVGDIKISATIPTRITEIGNAARSLSDADLERLERLGSVLQNLSSSGGNIRLSVATPSAAETTTPTMAEPTTQMAQAGAEIEETTTRAARLRDTLASIGSSIGTGIKSVVQDIRLLATSSDKASKAVRTLAKYTIGLPITLGSNLAAKVKESTASLGHLFSAIKRIALYRLIRSVIREITQGLREGINNIYAYSNALGGEFAAAMDSLASSSLYLKNSLGAMAAPILQSLIPAINFAIDRLVALMNVINMFVAALGGKATATIAKRVETTFGAAGAAAGGAAGAAKKALDDLRSYTLGIDELNIIDPTDKSGSGGGGGGGAGGGIDPSSMFEEVDINKGISDFATQIKDAFNRHDWKSLGTLLGGKFNEVVQGIKWDELGTKVGTGIGGLISTARWTLETADFRELGGKIATFFNNAVGEVNWSDFGALLVDKVTIGVDAVIGFVENLDTLELGRDFSDFLRGGFQRATEWIGNYQWSEIGTTIRTKVTDFLKGVDWDGVWNDLITFLKTFNHSALEFITALLGIDGPKTQKAIQKFFSNLFAHDNVTVGEDGMLYHKQKIYSNGIFSKPEYNYIPLSGDELSDYGLSLKGSGGRGITVPITPVVQNDGKKWRKDLSDYWSRGVNNKPPTSFGTNLRDDSSLWITDRNFWWDSKNRQPVSPFSTLLKDESGKWILTRNTAWNSKNGTPVAPFTTNVKKEGGKWRTDVENEWSKNTPTLRSNIGVNFDGASAWSKVKSAWDKNAGSLFAKIVMQVPVIQASMNSAILQGGIQSLFKLQGYTTLWGAKGGILDKATLIGAGEAGKEALLPLEQNTEWMDRIATKVRDSLSNTPQNFSFEGVDRVLSRLDEIERILINVDDSTRRQAEKPENTYVSIGAKTLRDAVTRQAAADGYSFA